MNDSENLINEIKQIKLQYQAEVGLSGRKVWPKAIRERILKLEEMKLGAKKIAAATGVPYETILQWRYNQNSKLKRSFHALELQPSQKRLTKNAAVTVASEKCESLQIAGSVNSNATVTVATPSGYRIEGSADVVLQILKSLGRLG